MKMIPATEEHLKEVVSWVTTEQDCQIWGGPSVSYPIKLSALIKEIKFRPDNSFVLKVQENVIGFGQVINTEENRNHLARVITNPKNRGTGYGFELCKALLAIANENQPETTLNVYRNNKAAVALYEKLGFKEDKEKSTSDNIFMLKTNKRM